MSNDTSNPSGPGDLLRSFLTGRDADCPQCGYNLRDLTGERCPECGEHLVLRINLAEPKLAAPIAGVVGLAAGAGLNALLILYWIIVAVFGRRGGSGEWGKFLAVNVINLLIVGGALVLWIRNWKKIRGLRAATRWRLVAGCVALSLADLVVFTAVIGG